jgi:hypothetical protein
MVRTKRKNLDHVSRRDERRARHGGAKGTGDAPDGPREPALAKG